MMQSLSGRACPDDETIGAFLGGELSPTSRAAIVDHAGHCASCRALLSELVKMERTTATPRTAPSLDPRSDDGTGDDLLASGSRVGRYVVLHCIGEGGMGAVYAARDPDLTRQVALKLLHRDLDGVDPASLRDRVLLEAQAMAQVAHPNVVTVHDVGTWQCRIFIAMEMVEGQTLSQWLAGAPRSWREIVATFTAAGEGLAAAHAAGVVHRDFKPGNVLIGRDGRVRVGDFGVAAVAVVPPPGPGETGVCDIAASGGRRSLIGSMPGTPYYMAPEQLLGRHVDARSDQFSFCVALHAAITGSHPFDGDTIEELLSSLLEGRRRRPARTMRIPRGLERAIERGLSADPDDRHPSMLALLESLRRSGARRRDTLLAPWIAGCALIAGGALALHGIDCSAAVGGARHLPAALEGAPPVPDAYEREWIAQHTSACESPGARCPIQATNLLREAGFDRRGYVWRPRPAPSSVRLNWVDGHLRIDAAAADASIVQEVPWIVPPGRSYQLTVRVRASDGAAPVRGRLVLSGMGLGGQSHSSTPFLARADWSQVSVTFSPKAHYDRVRAELALAAPGSIDIDGAELIDAGLIDASFEDASAVHRSTAWRPYNDQESVRTRWLATDAFDGLRAVEVRTARSGGSLAQDTTRMPLVGTTYTFVAWLRAGEGVPSVPGNLALWALGDGEERKVVKTGFDVGRSWTRVQASLDIEKYGYVALRAEVYVRADAPLEIDAARLIPAGLVDASFEAGSSAWYVLADSTATARRVVDPATPGPGGRTSLAKDGWHWLRLRSADARGSVAQNVPDPLGGTTYTFSAWLRAVPGSAAPVSGHLVIGALGGTSEESLTPFRIGAEWTLVTATLQVESDDHTALRVAVSLHGSGTEIDIDGTCLTGANPLLPSTP